MQTKIMFGVILYAQQHCGEEKHTDDTDCIHYQTFNWIVHNRTNFWH